MLTFLSVYPANSRAGKQTEELAVDGDEYRVS